MPVSKRLRYEVFRRDNYGCRYCGATAPDAKLTLDHVIPTVLGGPDTPKNLVTACSDCNSGKTSSNPDAPLVEDVTADDLRWAQAIKRAGEQMLADVCSVNEALSHFDGYWEDSGETTDPSGETTDPYAPPLWRPQSWARSIQGFLRSGLPFGVIVEMVDVTMSRVATVGVGRVKRDEAWRFFCGCCWKAIADQRELASKILNEDAAT